jgi:hypothetical protein
VSHKEDDMTEQHYDGRDEKEVQKREEKGGDEKSWEEKWRRDPLNAGTWAVIIIWVGLVFLADNLGLLRRFEIREAWGVIFLGAGVILLLEVLLRFVLPDFRRPVTGNIVFAVIALAAGLAILDLFDWKLIWAIALIAVGVGVLLQGLFRRS